LFTNARRARLRQPEPRRGEKSSGAGAKPEQPVCEQAVAFTLSGLHPVFVDFDRQSSDQPQAALQIGKDSDDMGAAFDLSS
jgi:hypothetical protein